jgi:hypothetical protein
MADAANPPSLHLPPCILRAGVLSAPCAASLDAKVLEDTAQRGDAPSGTWLADGLSTMADLLDTMLVELVELTQTVADLEQQEAEIRLRLAKMRALQAELLGTADALNRRRRETSVAAMHAPNSVAG